MIDALGHGRKKGAVATYGSLLLKTGQVTSYITGDDGDYEKGVAKAYTVNTAGAQSGTSSVVLAHYTGAAGAIAFNNATKKITDSGSGLAIIKTDNIIMTSSASNPGPFTVTSGNTAGEITCSGATFVNETPAGAITISKLESISNNTVLDNNTGLIWTRYVPTKFGLNNNGLMPLTNPLYSAFTYCAAANLATLGGYTDWRLPNLYELITLLDYGAPTAVPDATAFPSLVASSYAHSTIPPTATTRRYALNINDGQNTTGDLTDTARVLLVRGG